MPLYGLWNNLLNQYGTPAAGQQPTYQQSPQSLQQVGQYTQQRQPTYQQQQPGASPNYLGLARQGANLAGMSDVGSALGLISGVEKGGFLGDTSAAINAAKLGSNLGALPSSFGSTAAQYAPGLSVISGLEQGGTLGDLQAAYGAAQLAGNMGLLGAGGAAAVGALALPVGMTLMALESPAVSLTSDYWKGLQQDLAKPHGYNASPQDQGTYWNAVAELPNSPLKHPAAATLPNYSSAGEPAVPQTHRAATGGNVKKDDKGRSARQRKLKALKTRFDDGGYVDTGGDYTPMPIDNTSYTDQQYASPVTDWNPDTASQTTVQDPYGDWSVPATGQGGDTSGGAAGSGSSNSGVLGSLGNLLGVNSLGQFLQKYGALAPLLSSALGGNKQTSAPGLPSGYGAIPTISPPTSGRSYSQPNIANWYTYGQGPEASFYSNNQLPSLSGGAPQQNTAQPMPVSRPVMARGGVFDSQAGDSYVHDQGHGDGTSDPIDAKLSPGEYVMDAGTVSMLGNGSNEAGSRALDQLRQRVRKHAGKPMAKGKQFMKAKAPEQYLKEGAGE